MGFFSSRRSDDDHIVDNSEKTVVQVIRSRFYGKHKGKEPESPRPAFISQDTTTAQTLSIPITPNHVRKSHSTTFNGTKTSSPTASRTFSLSERFKSPRVKLSSPLANTTASTIPVTTPTPNDPILSKPAPDKDPKMDTSIPRKTTDGATMSLAQRLNELAVANSEGFLNDDEYRILRQNLFERFASNAAVPTENPVVPATPSRSHLREGSTPSEKRSSMSRPSSNFIVEVPRSPSIRSRTSIKSGMTSLFQRATGHSKQASKDYSDTSSVFSGKSTASQLFRSTTLNKKSSSASVRSIGSHQTDAISITSRKTWYGSERERDAPQTPRTTAGSVRHLATPPSSFQRSRSFVNESKYAGSLHTLFDDENLKTSQDIKNEIAAVEAEGRRLMDAFNGLEVTILAKRQRHPKTKPARIVELEMGGAGGDQDSMKQGSSTWTLTPDQRLPLKLDTDGLSIRSGMSTGTSPSISRSMFLKTLPSKTSNSMMSNASHSRPGSLHRKNSSSSMASSRAGGTTRSRIPPVPALPSGMGQYYGHTSNSSLNLTRSTGHLPMRSVPEDEVKMVSGDGSIHELDAELDGEMEEIRRRREDVSKRYAARVEYLKAKLKGAQLHEKLMKK